MSENDDDLPNIDEDDVTYFRSHKKKDKKPKLNEEDITYFPKHKRHNEKYDKIEYSYHDAMPNIKPNEIEYFPSYNSTNSLPNIDLTKIYYNNLNIYRVAVGNGKSNPIKIPSVPSLSTEEKQRFYPKILKYLERLWNKGYNSNKIYNLIKNKYDDSPIHDTVEEQIYLRLITVFFGLYNSKNELVLIDRLEHEFTSMSSDEIIELVKNVKSELEIITGTDLDFHWLNTALEEMEELKNKYENIKVVKEIFNNKNKDEQVSVMNLTELKCNNQETELKEKLKFMIRAYKTSPKTILTEEIIKKLRGKFFTKNNYLNLLNNTLKSKLLEFKKLHSTPANRLFLLTPEFLEWLAASYESSFEKLESVINLCYKINSNCEIAKFVIDLIQNTNMTHGEIVEKGMEIGINITVGDFLKKIGRNIVYYDKPEDYNKRFQIGVKKKKNFSYLRNMEISAEDWQNLANEELRNQFSQYNLETDKTAIIGFKITKVFSNWLEKRDDMMDLCKKINKNDEPIKFVMDLIQNTHLNQVEISDKTKSYGMSVNRNKIGKIAENIVYYGKKDEYDRRFKVGVSNERDLTVLRGNEYFEKDWVNLLNSQLHIKFKKYRDSSNLDSISGIFVTKKFKKWLSNDILDLNERQELINACNSINNNFEIAKFIIDQVAHTNFSKSKILRHLHRMGFTTNVQVLDHILNEVAFYNNPKGAALRFPIGWKPGEMKHLRNQEFFEKDWKSLTEPILKYKFLEFRKIFKNYPTNSVRIKMSFINFLENYEKIVKKKISNREIKALEKLRDLCLTINENFEIAKFIIDQIQHTDLDQTSILFLAESRGIHFSRDPIVKIAKEIVFYRNLNKYNQRFPSDNLHRLVGTKKHTCLAYLLTKFFLEYYGIKCFTTPKLYPNKNYQPDELILGVDIFESQKENENSVLNNLCLSLQLLAGKFTQNIKLYKAIILEFTSDLRADNQIRKSFKYESPDTLLLIIGTTWLYENDYRFITNDMYNFETLSYPNNTLVISYDYFVKLFQIDDSYLKTFKQIISFSQTYDLDNLEKLEKSLKTKLFNTNDLKDELISKSLTKNSFSEYFRGLKRKKRRDKHTQLKLF